MVLPMTTSNRKGVRFAPEGSMCSYNDPSEVHHLSQEVINDVWFQGTDYEEFRTHIKMTVDTAVRKGLSAYIKEPYGQEDSKTQEMLNLWARCRDTRRGLERYVNEKYGQQRLLFRRKAIQAVLYTQERLQKENQPTSRCAAILQTVASTLSANAVEFAIMMAVADREAVLSQQQTARSGRRLESIQVATAKGIQSEIQLQPSIYPPRSGKSPTQTLKKTVPAQ